ncbi:MAG: hypothetical protein ABI409_20600 [Ramlibacter sp.]
MAPAILQSDKPQAVAKPMLQPRHSKTVRLPQSTAELVNRMLAARCGGNR